MIECIQVALYGAVMNRSQKGEFQERICFNLENTLK